MNDVLRGFTKEYASSLQAYLAERDEAALLKAYEVGRRALDQGLGILDVAAMHREGLATALTGSLAPEECVRVAKGASDFLMESLSPFEMTQRGFREANLALRAGRQAHDEIRRYAAQLEAANKELEAFAFSVSHDLRAPLRAVDGFAQVLEEGYAQKLDDEGRRCLGILRAENRRMGQLIDDLLAFSRAGRAAMKMVEVDMAGLARSVFEDLRGAAGEREIEFKLAELAPAVGDRALLRQVLTNLLSNALKFTRRRPKAVIEVGGSAGHVENVYCIRDNGVGFDMKYVQKLFGVFQRLHSQEEFEGTGVGLGIVQRIVHRHGGRVWAEGKVNGGAAFHFALPNAGATEEEAQDPD